MASEDFLTQLAMEALQGFERAYVPFKKKEHEDVLARQRKREEIELEAEERRKTLREFPTAIYDSQGNFLGYRQAQRTIQLREPKPEIQQVPISAETGLPIAPPLPEGQRGIKVGTPKIKESEQKLSTFEERKLTDYDSFLDSLENVISQAKANKDLYGRYIGAVAGQFSGGGISGTIGKYAKTKEFLTFESDVGQMFQDYRSARTGAQAAFKELGLLETNLPSIKDKNIDTFISKGESTLNTLKMRKKRFLDLIRSKKSDIEKYSFSKEKLQDISNESLLEMLNK